MIENMNIQKLGDLLKGHIKGQVVNQEISRLTAPGDNFGSLMLKVDIKVKDGDTDEIIHAVAKCVPPNKEIQGIFNIPITFKNEMGWYTTAIPTMIEFQRSQGVKDIADFFMNIYGARLSLDQDSEEVDDDGVILCENLAVKGYGNVDRRTGFDLKQSKQILKKLATFHSLSLALKLKEPKMFEDKVNIFLHTIKREDEVLAAFEPALGLLRAHSETSALVPRVQEALKYIGSKADSMEVREPWVCAIHNDFWVNNIMVREEKGKALEVIILDLQTCQYGSPIDDLLFFLGSSVQTDLAEKYFDDLIKLYYIELIENLKSLNVDTNLFPYESFQKELELQGAFQFAHCMFFVGIILAEREKGVDTITDKFDPQKELINMFRNITGKHKEKYIFLTKEYAKRNWI